MPFRDAHGVAGKCVAAAEDKGCSLSELTYEDYNGIHSAFEEDITKIWDFETSVDQYSATGGTGRTSVQGQIDALKVLLA